MYVLTVHGGSCGGRGGSTGATASGAGGGTIRVNFIHFDKVLENWTGAHLIFPQIVHLIASHRPGNRHFGERSTTIVFEIDGGVFAHGTACNLFFDLNNE